MIIYQLQSHNEMEIVNRSLAFQPAGLWKRSEMSKDRRLWLDMRKWIWAKILWPCIKGIIKSKKSRFSARIYRVSSYPRHFRDISGTFPWFPTAHFPMQPQQKRQQEKLAWATSNNNNVTWFICLRYFRRFVTS